MSHDIIALSAQARSATIDIVKSKEQVDKKQRKLADIYHADGIRGVMLETEKKGGSVELRTSIKDAIVAGFTADQQALIAKNPATLDSAQKHDRTTLKNKVDKYLTDIRKYLYDDEADGSSDPRETKTEFQRIHAALDSVLQKLQKFENPSFDVVETVKRIKLGKSLIPAV